MHRPLPPYRSADSSGRAAAALASCALLWMAVAGPPASAFPLPTPSVPYRIVLAVVGPAPDAEADSHAALEAEMAAEHAWTDGGGDDTPLVTYARFEGPTVLNFPIRLALAEGERVTVTVVERDRRRVWIRVVEQRGAGRDARVVRFLLNRYYRPAEGRVVVALSESRWLRVWLRRP